MKFRRSDRLVDMTDYFVNRPHTLIPLPFFAKRYNSAKSSISEDLTIIRRTFKERGIGRLKTFPGASGGAVFSPYMKKNGADEFINGIARTLNDDDRFLPGGYVYMSDILGKPQMLHAIGKIFATQYLNQEVDEVLTVATRGIPVAEAVANYLNVPLVVAQHDSQITEGSTVSVNYVSGSSKKIKKMTVSKRILPENTNVLIVDDFIHDGGTLTGLKSLIKEFNCHLAGSSIFAEGIYGQKRPMNDFTSLLKMVIKPDSIEVTPGNYDKKIYQNFSE